MLCPKCQTEHAHHSHRAGLGEHLASILGYRPYRCHKCSHRFLSFRYSLPEPDAPPVLGAEKEIAATRGSLRRRQKRREFLLYGSALTVFVVILYFLVREPSVGD
jgi:DNA-directed RNA polymerase subunit RPC12/RpoP